MSLAPLNHFCTLAGGDLRLSLSPEQQGAGIAGVWGQGPCCQQYSLEWVASPRQLLALSTSIVLAAGMSQTLESRVLGSSPASVTHSGYVVLAKLPSISEPHFLFETFPPCRRTGGGTEADGNHLAHKGIY